MRHILVLGGGTAGTMMANKLVRRLEPGRWQVTVVDRDPVHLYQPGLLFVPFGTYRPDEIQRPRHSLLAPDVDLVRGELARIDPERKQVHLADGTALPYDVLIVATGTRIVPEATEGLTGRGWREDAFDFYTLEGATALAHKLDRWPGGRLVLNVAEMPIKCPVAPLEFLFLADAFFTERGMREKVEIVYATPLDGAFTKPRASALLGDMLATRDIHVETDFNVAKVDPAGHVMQGFDGRELAFDLLVSIPPHAGAKVVSDSGLGDHAGFFPTHKHTLQSLHFPDVFALGDATDLPSSKAGSVAHFQAEVLVENVLRHVEGRPLEPGFDGHANCFVETGHGKAVLIDFNYTTEPLPGRFPLPGIGPFTLLEESYTNHWGKLGFRWVYWNLLLKGEELPLDHRMALAGKWA
ncbi:MAG: type III sulfide quinone reductase, selenoprotein subtype [Myxococcota bacterium]